MDLEGSITFLILIISMHIDRLGFLSHFYGTLFINVTMCPDSWAGVAALCIEVR